MFDPRDAGSYPLTTDLAALVAVAETGSMGAAARSLGLAQPNVSRALGRLERRLGLTLLTRRPRGSTLTAAGAMVVDWAGDVLRAHRTLLAGASALAGERGTLRVAASQTVSEALLPRWLTTLRQHRPDARIDLTVTNSTEVGRLISIDTVLGFIESPQLPATISVPATSALLGHDRLVVVVAPGHSWARRTRPITVAELAATPLVVREAGSGTRVSLELAMAGHTMAQPALQLNSNAAVRVAVAAGAGPAVLSELAIATAVAAGELQAVMVDGLVVERPIQAVWAKSTDLGTDARLLLSIAAADQLG